MSAFRALLSAAALFGGSAVLLGAFGAHGLKGRLSPEALQVFETGVRYQMYHALALVAAAWMADRVGGALPLAAGVSFATGVLLFSGSLYLLATRALTGTASWTWLGPVTPLGGLCFFAGWVVLGLAALRAA